MVSDLVVTPTIIRTPIHRIDTMTVIHKGFTKPTVSEMTLVVVLEEREGLRDFRLPLLSHSQTSITVVEVDCGGRFVVNRLIHCETSID